MKLLLDQGLPRTTVRYLAALGIASEHVGNLGMATASDAAILARAEVDQAIVVTLDADFHAILATTAAIGPSVIRIRIEGLTGVSLANLLEQVLQITGTELAAGAMVTVTPPNVVRVRMLPVV